MGDLWGAQKNAHEPNGSAVHTDKSYPALASVRADWDSRRGHGWCDSHLMKIGETMVFSIIIEKRVSANPRFGVEPE